MQWHGGAEVVHAGRGREDTPEPGQPMPLPAVHPRGRVGTAPPRQNSRAGFDPFHFIAVTLWNSREFRPWGSWAWSWTTGYGGVQAAEREASLEQVTAPSLTLH